MKKLSLIFICVLVVAALCLPTIAFGESKVANDVHFIAPTGIALVGDNLLISDNVADGQSAILCFDISSGVNSHKFTYLLDKQATSMTSSNGRLFVIFGDSFAEYTIVENTLSLVETYDIANVIDVCVAQYTYNSGTVQERIYFLAKGANGDTLQYVKQDKTVGPTNMTTVATGYNILPLSDGNKDYVYIAGKTANGSNSITRFGSFEDFNIAEDTLNKGGVTYASGDGFELLGLASNNRNFPVLFGAKSMYNLHGDSDTFRATDSFADFSSSEHNIIKIASNSTHLTILNDNNQVQIYQLISGANGTELSSTDIIIGSDQVDAQVPTTYTSFTLAKSSGYPTNIIYKTNDDKTSVDSILTKEQVDKFIILGYEGHENASYYYVFVNGKFGWIKKSDNATTADTDSKIEIVDTKVSDKVSYNAKFSSLGNVYIYNLPTSNETIRKVIDQQSQTGSTLKDVKILQQFTEAETNVVWYYVEYDQGSRGFVKSSNVANFTATLVEPVDAVVDKQINASLFNAVTLHMTKELDPDTLITDGNQPIKLYSGDLVKVIEVDQEAGSALIQVVNLDGTTTFGWVESSRLIDTNAITTNAVVGLTALGIAIVLAIVLFSVFISRKKKSR